MKINRLTSPPSTTDGFSFRLASNQQKREKKKREENKLCSFRDFASGWLANEMKRNIECVQTFTLSQLSLLEVGFAIIE